MTTMKKTTNPKKKAKNIGRKPSPNHPWFKPAVATRERLAPHVTASERAAEMTGDW